MSETFGSYGRRDRVTFGQRGQAGAMRMRPMPAQFGKRTGPPMLQVSLQRQRLHLLHAELQALFGDPAYPGRKLPFHLLDSEDLMIAIDGGAGVRLDPDTGMYVFSNDDAQTGSLLMTANQDRMMDFILSHLARGHDALSPNTSLALVEKFVGYSVADMERTLILATLRHCFGNRTHAARLLGISLRTLRNKLRSYWGPGETSARSGEDRPSRRSEVDPAS